MKNKILHFISKPTHIAPLIIFRIVFGAVLFFSTLRFMLKGWIHDLYVEPQLFFTYYGFEWVKPLSEPLMYLLFGALAFSFLLQTIGLFYRTASIFSFLTFTYIELIDKTNYLNHYYFVSIVCFLLIFVPANRYFSLDVKRNQRIRKTHIPNYFLLVFQLQLAIVYFYAGLAKLNYDWLINAMPLKIWLPSKSDIPFFGNLLQKEWTAYLFSWFGVLYDLCIPFLLFYNKTRRFAYFFVIVFHIFTYALFQIGMFPFIMIGATLIFFSADFHQHLIHNLRRVLKIKELTLPNSEFIPISRKTTLLLFGIFLIIQLAFPFRHLFYSNNLYWSEEGYRFSWRVMLMEKAGYAIFHINNPESGLKWEVNNYEFLTPNQEKMMSTQPDMILQYAHFLKKYYQSKGIKEPEITAEVYVTLNGRQSALFIDPSVDLTKVKESFAPKEWVLPFNERSSHDNLNVHAAI